MIGGNGTQYRSIKTGSKKDPKIIRGINLLSCPAELPTPGWFLQYHTIYSETIREIELEKKYIVETAFFP